MMKLDLPWANSAQNTLILKKDSRYTDTTSSFIEPSLVFEEHGGSWLDLRLNPKLQYKNKFCIWIEHGKNILDDFSDDNSPRPRDKQEEKENLPTVQEQSSICEQSLEKNGRQPHEPEEEKSTKLKGYVTQVEEVSAVTDQPPSISDLHWIHMIQTLQALLFIWTLPDVPYDYLQPKMIELPPPDDPSKTQVLLFDLDETLVHCIEEYQDIEVDHVITIHFPDGEIVDAGLNIWPFAIEALQAANENFQVVVFTASHQSYADAVLDFIDPDR